MDSCIAYYGGKANLTSELLPLIPPHKQYVECFSGGASLLFSKQKSDNECINDKNEWVTTFFWQCKNNFEELQRLIQSTPHSERWHQWAKIILKGHNYPPVLVAHAFWIQCNMSFGHKIFGGFRFSESGEGKNTSNKRDNFTKKYYERLKEVEIFCRDAVELIKLKDSPNTFFYVDPPYVSSNQGHYSGYTTEDFIILLETLSNIKGKFLLSSYPEDILMDYRAMNNWNSKDMEMVLQVTGKRKTNKLKTESLTWNYELAQQKLF